MAFSPSFEAHQPGSAKITANAHHEAKISLQRCRSATFVKSVWDLGPSEDQDVLEKIRKTAAASAVKHVQVDFDQVWDFHCRGEG